MPFADKHPPIRKNARTERHTPHIPMGDQRYQQLMSELGAALAQVDDGEEKRRQARAQEQRHEEWMRRRQVVIADILATLNAHGLTPDDLD